MKIHEYQGKELLKNYGVPVPRGIVARTPEEAEQAARELGGDLVVVKAQIHAGGRGKAGGVKVCKDIDSVKKAVKEIIGKTLVTPQTGPQGKKVHKVWIEEGSNIARELYLGIVTDRAVSQVVMMASTEGGMEIEEVAGEVRATVSNTWDRPVWIHVDEARPAKLHSVFQWELIPREDGETRLLDLALPTAREQVIPARKIEPGESFVLGRATVHDLREAVKKEFASEKIDVQDGIRIDWNNAWVHARPSNTEPIMRIIAEAPDRATAEKKIEMVQTVVKRVL